MSTCEVFCYGELGVDNLIRVPFLPSPEKAVFPTHEAYHIGGAAANTAAWLAYWDVPVKLAGNAIGGDLYGQQLLEWLDRYPSLNLEQVEIRPNFSTPFCRVMVTPDGERTFLIFGYPQAPKKELTASMLDGARFLALDLYGGEERFAAAQTATQAGAQTVVGDVIWPDHAVLPLTAIALNSAAYIRETYPGIDVREHAKALQAISGGIVVTTDGPNDIHVIDPAGAEFLLTPPEVTPVDATGAGDAFRAGFIYGLLRAWPLPKCASFGAAAGALSVLQEGAASQPADLETVGDLADPLHHRPL